MPTFENSVSLVVPTRIESGNVVPLASQIVSRPVPLQEILFVDNSTDSLPLRALDYWRCLPAPAE